MNPFLYALCATIELGLYLVLGAASLHLLRRALWALRRGPLSPPPAGIAPSEPPFVTVQLPLRNEPAVAEGALRSAAALAWPRDRFEIQVLDDSDDETLAIVDRTAAELRAAGVSIEILRRPDRKGYKAGALAAGLAQARGERVLVLDADFRPEPTLLATLSARLDEDPRLAFCQARWSFRNEQASVLTGVQAAILDALFAVEQAELSEAGAPVQFNGTAGMWRREAIERAGGWATTDDALTEDLDLSFRAHALGLRGVTLPAVAVSTELPESMSSFRTQQARWVRGGALTLRTLGRRLFRGRVSDAATMLSHLVRHARQPLFVAAALRLCVVAYAGIAPICPPWIGVAVFAATLVATALYLGAAERRLGQGFLAGARRSPSLFFVSMGLAPALTLAFLGGVAATAGGFVRTEKRGDGAPVKTRRTDLSAAMGLVVACAAVAAFIVFVRGGDVPGSCAALFVAVSCLWVAR